MLIKTKFGKRQKKIFVRTFGAVIGSDVGFLEVALDPYEIRIDEKAAVDEEGALTLALGVAGYLSSGNSQVTRLVEFQNKALLAESFNEGRKCRFVSAHNVEASERRRQIRHYRVN